MVYNRRITEMRPGWGPLTVFSDLKSARGFYDLISIPELSDKFTIYEVRYTKSKGTKLWCRGNDALTNKPIKLVTTMDQLKKINESSFKEYGVDLDHVHFATRVELLERII